jgi:hypothetical protein
MDLDEIFLLFDLYWFSITPRLYGDNIKFVFSHTVYCAANVILYIFVILVSVEESVIVYYVGLG